MTEQHPRPDPDRDAASSVSALSAETAVLGHQIEEGSVPAAGTSHASPSESVFRRRLRKFRRIKRGYWSFLVIAVAYGVSFLLPVLANNVALVVRYQERYYFSEMIHRPSVLL